MSSSLAGAEMMTFLAPPSMCLAAASRLVNRPVDSMTISAPRSSQGSAAGIFLGQHLHLVAGRREAPVRELDFLLEATEHRVVLQEMRQHRGIGEVVDGNDVEITALRSGGPKEVAPDATEAIDSYAGGHRFSLPVAEL